MHTWIAVNESIIMRTEQVVEGARLIDQLGKLDEFIQHIPQNSDTLTITFRGGKYSKSLSLRDEATIINIRAMVEQIRSDTIAAIQELGIEL